MSSVHQRALQAVKAFRLAVINRPAPYLPRNKRSPGAPRTNPFLVTRVMRHSPTTRKAGDKLNEAKRLNEEITVPPMKYHTHAPRISLRRQADLAKKARLTNILHLLPPSPKVAALQLREQRLRAGLPSALTELLDSARQPVDLTIELTERLGALTVASRRPLVDGQLALDALLARAEKLKEEIAEFEVNSLVDTKNESVEMQMYNRRKEQFAALTVQVERQRGRVAKLNGGMKRLQAAITKEQAAQAWTKAPHWQLPVKWVGEVPVKKTVGEELGVRLYAGRKRMFKGHLWERRRESRERTRSLLMRGMAARVKTYKEYYKKRKPNPLKPSRLSKPPKLPF